MKFKHIVILLIRYYASGLVHKIACFAYTPTEKFAYFATRINEKVVSIMQTSYRVNQRCKPY